MSLSEDIRKYRQLQIAFHPRVPADIVERWMSRIIPNNLHLLGEKGAEAYLARFGRTIGEEKTVYLAIKAEIEGCQDMANGFWKKAYNLKTDESKSTSKKSSSIATKKRRLMILEEQQARFGSLTPPHIIMEIEDLRRELEAFDGNDTT